MSDVLHRQINLRQVSPNTYSASWHHDWVIGKTLMGGHVAAVLMQAVRTHLSTDAELVARNQPDVLNLHAEFLRACELKDSIVTIRTLKTGSSISTLQLEMAQENHRSGKSELKVIAFATLTNFDKNLGPSASTDWALNPQPKPLPDFALVEAHKPEPNWLPATVSGEILPFTHRTLALNPRGGYPVAGVYDAWYSFLNGERMDATYFGVLSDFIPSVTDSLSDKGVFSAHYYYKEAEEWAKEHPGIPAPLTNSIAEAMKGESWNQTVTLNLEFRKRIPTEGLRWVFIRTATKIIDEGRLGVDITLCDENMNLVCEAHQLCLALEIQRKGLDFRKPKGPSL